MGTLPGAWRTLGPALARVAKAGKVLVGTAGLITTTLEALLKARGGSGNPRGHPSSVMPSSRFSLTSSGCRRTDRSC